MSENDVLKSLSRTPVPPATSEARDAAMAAAMAAFDAEAEKISTPVQGAGAGARLMSILSDWKGRWTMDMRMSLGATMVALVLLPMGVYLVSQTALTPVETFSPTTETTTVAEGTTPIEVAEVGEAVDAETRSDAVVVAPQPVEPTAVAPTAPEAELRSSADAAAPPPMMMEAPLQQMTGMPAPSILPMPTRSAENFLGGGAVASGDQFASFETNGVMQVSEAPVSTFSVDVDTASYAFVRRMLETGMLPQPDAVRVEEMINAFSYDYPTPTGEVPFATDVEIAPSPWDADNQLIRIGISGEAVDLSALPPSNLVFLIDTSGSMDSPDKLPLLQRAFTLLVEELGPDDTVSIVTYAGSAGVVLEPTPASERATIISALERLVPGGSTAGEAGIETAYDLAEQAMVDGGVNRVILATDGDFNVGISDPDALERLIEQRREAGISLSVLGFGTGNYNDAAMQALAQAGNGNAAYIDSFTEARRVLVEEMGGTLVTIAEDVKIQIEFNPAAVSEYRLIGYETRALTREDFNNDAVDAGEIGAGHTVTAIYEITPVGAPGSVDPLRYQTPDETDAAPSAPAEELAFLRLRYKEPGTDDSILIEQPLLAADAQPTLAAAGEDMEFAVAVAAFGQKLRGVDALDGMDWDAIRALAVAGQGDDPTGRRAEFIGLVDLASSLDR